MKSEVSAAVSFPGILVLLLYNEDVQFTYQSPSASNSIQHLKRPPVLPNHSEGLEITLTHKLTLPT